MSEVKRYEINGTFNVPEIGQKLENPKMVMEADFDRVTAERDALQASIVRLNDKISCMSAHVLAYKLSRQRLLGRARVRELLISELQQRLTAADERNDNRDFEIFAQVQSALRRSFSLGQIYWQQADSDSTCQQNKSDQTMEVQEQHILNVLKSLGDALKPADSADYRKSCEAAHKALSMENQRIVSPGQFKCLACGDIHPGSGNLPCPKMSPTS